jgi:hypothetical protein
VKATSSISKSKVLLHGGQNNSIVPVPDQSAAVTSKCSTSPIGVAGSFKLQKIFKETLADLLGRNMELEWSMVGEYREGNPLCCTSWHSTCTSKICEFSSNDSPGICEGVVGVVKGYTEEELAG